MITQTLLILAGGASSRMKKPTTTELPTKIKQQANLQSKALIELNGRPMLDYILYNAKVAGITSVVLIIGKNGKAFKQQFGGKTSNNNYKGLSISYAVQEIPDTRKKPLGTADAVYQALMQYPELQTQPFLVCNADNLYSSSAISSLRLHPHPNALIAYDRAKLQFEMKRIAQFALLKIAADDVLTAIIEKPEPEDLEKYKATDGSFRVSMNIFKLDGKRCFSYLKDCPLHPIRNEKELPAVISAMINDDAKSIQVLYRGEHVPDLTAKDDILIMNDYLSTHIKNLDWT